MNSRRKFLTQGALATVAVMAAKPVSAFSSIDQLLSPSEKANTLNLFYTNNSFLWQENDLSFESFKEFSKKIKNFKSPDCKNIWLDSSYSVFNRKSLNNEHSQFLESIQEVNSEAGIESISAYSDELGYKIIKLSKGRVGVITENIDRDNESIFYGMNNLSHDIHSLASELKAEKKCTLVIVASSRNNNLDYLELAQNSCDIDIVMGILKTSSRKISTVKNKLKNEVILINQGGEVKKLLRKIEIKFDENGLKKSIQFNNLFI